MAHDVFISHSSKDKPAADAVCALLESDGIRCWIAPRDIQAGVSYAGALIDAINDSRAMVLIFSGAANASPQIEREIERAANRRIPILPFRIEDVQPQHGLEYFLSTPHWLDAFTPPLETHIRELAHQLHALLGPSETGPITPPALAAAAGIPPKPEVAAAPPPVKKRVLSGGALAAVGVVAAGGVAAAGATVWLSTQHRAAPPSAEAPPSAAAASAASSAQGSGTVALGAVSAASSGAGSGSVAAAQASSQQSAQGSGVVAIAPHRAPAGVTPFGAPRPHVVAAPFRGPRANGGRMVAAGGRPPLFRRFPPPRRFRRRPGLA